MAERPGLLIPSPVPSGIAPPGPLMIRGGGAIGVSTDAMLAVGARLGTLAEVLGGLQRRVADAPRAVGAGVLLVAGDAWLGPAGELDFRRERLAALLRATADAARDLRERLRRAALDYQRAEESLRWLEQAQAARIGYGVGRALPLLLIVALELAGVAWVAWQLTPGSDAAKKEALRRFLVAHPELVTSPQFVSFVRGFSSSLDDALLGAAGMPWPVAWVLGGNGSGTGVEVGGTAILGLGGAIGLFQESDVRVRRVPDQITRTGPPATLRERLDRVPANPPDDPATPADESAQRGPHVRIERYDAPGATPRWIVYVDPTETFSPARSVEPWDLTSNVDGVAGRTAASFAATEAAMKDAGVAPSDPVQFVGFSQGGLVAGMLAGSGRWNAAGLDTFAAPIGNIPLPADLPGVNVRHTDDLVPALAGADLPSGRMLIEQRAFPAGIPTTKAVPAHQLDSYQQTADAIDATRSPEVRAQLERMRRFAADQAALPGATMSTYTYQATRVGPNRPAWLEPVVDRRPG